MIRVAMLSFWHVHGKDYALQTEEHSDTEIVAVWDEVPERGRAEAAKRNAPFYENLDELLAQPNIDAVVVTTPTNMHADVMIAAARAGKHIFTEKVIAATLREAESILQEVQRAGVKFVVAMRRLPMASTRAVMAVIDQGLIGDPTLVLVRDSHSGVLPTEEHPRGMLSDAFLDPVLAQGGALIDMCHAVYLTRYFLGRPESVSASFGHVTGREIEDNAVVTMRHANGGIGIAQVGYVTSAAPFSIEVHGTQGSVLYSEPGIGEFMIRRSSGLQPSANYAATAPDRKLHLLSAKLNSVDWAIQEIDAGTTTTPFDQWVAHIQENTLADENNAIGHDLTAVIEAAYQSAESGQAVRLDSLAGADD
ncbi:MAG: Gfo/Idh/MocA family oxidoreductase [Anaerolineaceae bacterium]|nr:Gfo/Idh/MocA family oxidoreductase [Anaerolineaceae bacterium]